MDFIFQQLHVMLALVLGGKWGWDEGERVDHVQG